MLVTGQIEFAVGGAISPPSGPGSGTVRVHDVECISRFGDPRRPVRQQGAAADPVTDECDTTRLGGHAQGQIPRIARAVQGYASWHVAKSSGGSGWTMMP